MRGDIYPEDCYIRMLCNTDYEMSEREMRERELIRESNHLRSSIRAYGPDTCMISGISKATALRIITNLINEITGGN